MPYQLWDLAGGGLLGMYATEAEALAWVRCYLEDDGPEYVADLGLDGPTKEGGRVVIAVGEKLADLALTVPAAVA